MRDFFQCGVHLTQYKNKFYKERLPTFKSLKPNRDATRS
jgi:hypothetical protein